MRADLSDRTIPLEEIPMQMAAMERELKLLRELQSAVTDYLSHSGRAKAWISIDTLRATVARIRKEIDS